MDEPLFGERSKKTNVFIYVIAALVSAFVLFTLVVAIIKGIHEKQHFVLAVAMLFQFVLLTILTKWYNSGDLDPRFKWIILLMVLNLLLVAVALNVYAWKKEEKIECEGLFNMLDKSCLPICSPNTCLSVQTGSCFTIPRCNNTMIAY